MAIAKTPKTVPAAKPATAKPVAVTSKPVAAKPVAAKPVAVKAPIAKPAFAKPVAAIAATSTPDEEAVVHSAEIVTEQASKAVETVTKAVDESIKTVQAAAAEVAIKPSKAEIAVKPAKAVAVVAKPARDAGESILQGVAPLIDFSRENAILFVATGNQLALGFHKLSQSLIDWSAESCDKSVAAGQAMLAAKTVEEVIDLSQSLAKDSLEQLFKEGSELSALSSKLIEDTIAPLPGRLAAAVEKLASHAA